MKRLIIIFIVAIILLIAFLSRYKYLSTVGGPVVRINRFTGKITTYDYSSMRREYYKVQSKKPVHRYKADIDYSDFKSEEWDLSGLESSPTTK